VDELIAAVDKAARNCPRQKSDKAFPGPNSNAFTAWVAKQIPELELKLPFTAVGKGYVN
jgi:hypothetical protein